MHRIAPSLELLRLVGVVSKCWADRCKRRGSRVLPLHRVSEHYGSKLGATQLADEQPEFKDDVIAWDMSQVPSRIRNKGFR